MSEHERDMSDGAFIRRFAKVIAGLCGIIVLSFVTAGIFSCGQHPEAKLAEARNAQQVAPVAEANTSAQAAAPAAAAPAAAARSGEQIVTGTCAACHGTGMLGAPKIGSKADWQAKLSAAGGIDAAVKNAIHGIGNMPPRGGDSTLTDAEVHDAVEYMLGKSGISG
ncbi:MAG: cytochrome c5 family protein [Nevskiaceae bacterium]|nr:MAG: cytochrome c5 family protein [Nevskiaceae bacterium]TBR72549.1 MAG: cytochrome c5 family protein [Nevskiaceae bacterium]